MFNRIVAAQIDLARKNWLRFGLLDVFRNINQHRPRTPRLRDVKRLFHDPRDIVDIGDEIIVLDAQAAAWNRGDIEGYMNGYDRSPNTEFVGADSITRGWQDVLDRYKKRYDTREKMGTLTFSDLEITMLSKDAALVLGRWHLKRANDEPHGTFTLLFRKTKTGWKIVHDHTSSA